MNPFIKGRSGAAAAQTGNALKTALRILLPVLLVWNDLRLMSVLGGADRLPLYLLLPAYGVSLVAVVVMLRGRVAWIRKGMEVLLFSILFTDGLYLLLGGFPFSTPDAINLFNNPGYAPNAWMAFRLAFLLAFAASAIVYALVQRAVGQPGGNHAYAGLWTFLTVQGILYVAAPQHPALQDYFPAVYRVTANLVAGNRLQPEARWRRTEVKTAPVGQPVRCLFLVVDESVAGPALSMNGFPVATTPFLQAHADRFINFGTGPSFTNYSAGSNMALLSGLMPDELPDRCFRSFAKPGLFRYAKKAGYCTYLLDAQSAKNKLQNYMAPQDTEAIDSFIRVRARYPDAAAPLLDGLLAEEMAAIAARGGQAFVYVNKAGAHWPYEWNVPDLGAGIALRGHPSGSTGNPLAYFRSLFWNVDRFWQRLTALLPPGSEVLVLYTSDHGENYAAPSFRVKHASVYRPHAAEGSVPLLAYDRAGFFPGGYTPARNRYGHRHLFPTLLLAMGYHRNFVHAAYGNTLLDPPDGVPGWFLSGDLFGRGRTQKVVVPEEESRG